MKRGIVPSLCGSLLLVMASAGNAHAGKPWVDRPLTLPMLHLSADAGLGFGQGQTVTMSPGGIPSIGSSKLGVGSNLEAAVGLPILGELSVRTGVRFGDTGKAAAADTYGRLFDKETFATGGDTFANPELALRGTLLDLEIVQIGLETRFVIPAAQGSDFALVPGIPLRVHIPSIARIDTGVYFPIVFADSGYYAIDVPANLWFQAGDAFFGPLVGFRSNHNLPIFDNRFDLRVGAGAGYTFGGVLDVKAQLYADRINDSEWSHTIGGGLGVGIYIP